MAQCVHVTIRTLKSQIHHGLQNLHISAAKARAEGFAQILSHVGGYVNTDFVSQCGRAHGEAEACGESVQLLGVNPFLYVHDE